MVRHPHRQAAAAVAVVAVGKYNVLL